MKKEGNCCLLGLGSLFPGSQRSSVQGQVFAVMKAAGEQHDHLIQVRLLVRVRPSRPPLWEWWSVCYNEVTLDSLCFSLFCQLKCLLLRAPWLYEGQKGKSTMELIPSTEDHKASAEGITSPGFPPGGSHLQSQGDPQHNTQPIVCQPYCPYFPFNNSSTFNTNTRTDKFWACVYLRVKRRKRYLQICSSTQ